MSFWRKLLTPYYVAKNAIGDRRSRRVQRKVLKVLRDSDVPLSSNAIAVTAELPPHHVRRALYELRDEYGTATQSDHLDRWKITAAGREAAGVAE